MQLSAASAWLIFYMSGRRKENCKGNLGQGGFCKAAITFTVKQQFLGAALCRTELSFSSPSADGCCCIPGSGQVGVGGWCAEPSCSLQIICRLQVIVDQKSLQGRSWFSCLDKQGLMWDFMRFLYCFWSTWFPLRKHCKKQK